ncbi:VOC family protein [Catenulispora pinisilvae]|uniref:VOC family protein n=1 Tax=Catenulispora pinisilvae TaxID=2705253 RepID=UPI002B26DAA4|nr:VOC family protein [Catenulispora pinisilvae]
MADEQADERAGAKAGERAGGKALGLASVFPAARLADGVQFLVAVLGIEPTFVDGERWAQFDLGGARLALASGAESSGAAQVMVKVADAAATAERLSAAGYDVAGPVTGPHEVRFSVTGPDGWSVVGYQPL